MTATHTIDERRVRAIQDYDVLRSARGQLHSVVELSAKVAGVSKATVNILTDTDQHQVATVGFVGRTTPREQSFCSRVVDGAEPVMVPDAGQDPRFRDHPLCTGELDAIKFYAAHPLVTPEGVPIGTLCVFDDEARPVDDGLREALRTLATSVVDAFVLERALRELAEANARLTTFAGQVSHDLKNPLASVLMAVELAVDATDDPQQTELLERAHRGAKRMGILIDDLLHHARTGATRTHVEVSVAQVLAEVREDLVDSLAEARLVVGDLPTVRTDPLLLRVVLQNLLANAAKFSDPERPLLVEVLATREGPDWRIEVRDTGIGIAAHDLPRVFEPQVRVSDAITGHGIGLDTCKRVVTSLGGRIGVESDLGKGSTFWFTLPAD